MPGTEAETFTPHLPHSVAWWLRSLRSSTEISPASCTRSTGDSQSERALMPREGLSPAMKREMKNTPALLYSRPRSRGSGSRKGSTSASSVYWPVMRSPVWGSGKNVGESGYRRRRLRRLTSRH
jgi:hypothetical protein